MATEKHFKYVVLGGGVSGVRPSLHAPARGVLSNTCGGQIGPGSPSLSSLFQSVPKHVRLLVTGLRGAGVREAGRPARGARHHLQGGRNYPLSLSLTSPL
jgi:hypothetical protein